MLEAIHYFVRGLKLRISIQSFWLLLVDPPSMSPNLKDGFAAPPTALFISSFESSWACASSAGTVFSFLVSSLMSSLLFIENHDRATAVAARADRRLKATARLSLSKCVSLWKPSRKAFRQRLHRALSRQVA